MKMAALGQVRLMHFPLLNRDISDKMPLWSDV